MQTKSMRVTIADVAREAGVSTATVDRVVNGRNGVRTRTRDRVLTIAHRLGYAITEPAGNLAPVGLDFVLPGGTNTYLNLLAQELEQAGSPQLNVRVQVHRIEGFSPDALARKLQELHGNTQGVGIVALDHPKVREAIRDLGSEQVPILTMVSDISDVPRIGYIGIDNRAAGRLAGHLLGSFIRSGGQQVALFAGSLSYRGHEEREMGFRHILSEEFSDLVIVQLRENLDDMDRSYVETKTLLEASPDLAGIYNIGAGNRGIARALEESGKAADVVFIGHELTEHSRQFLLSGTMNAVIDQNPRLEAREAVTALTKAVRGQATDRDSWMIGMQVIFRENIPPR
jgi:LacI family transcriptional regulator